MKTMLKNALIKTVFASSVAFGFSFLAAAEVIKLTDSATLQQQSGERYFSQDGISGETVIVLETAGADMPLPIAISRIVPDSWKVLPSGGYNDALVSWRGGVSWPIIMRNIANNEGIYVSLDWIAKTATINVPGQTESENKILAKSYDVLIEDRQDFRKKQRQDWERRRDNSAALSSERKQFENMMDKQRRARESNQEFISQLNQNNQVMGDNIESLKEALAQEKLKNDTLVEQYAVIDPNLGDSDSKLDATELFEKYNEQWVLPFDDSFEYYLKGGHTDIIETHTPATYLAKKGTVEEVLSQWAKVTGWHVEYNAGVQHYNPYEVHFKGSFIESSTKLVSIFSGSDRAIDIKFFPDVLVTDRDGNRKKGLARVIDLNYKKR
jgi:hypothetical protein